jgi:hypothetical protein
MRRSTLVTLSKTTEHAFGCTQMVVKHERLRCVHHLLRPSPAARRMLSIVRLTLSPL